MVKEIEGIVYDTDNMEEICSHFPMWGMGVYSILYKDSQGVFFIESGVCDDSEYWEESLRVVSVDDAKDYVKDFGEMSWGLGIEDNLDDLISEWKRIFDEDITEW